MGEDNSGLVRAGDLLPAIVKSDLKPLSRIQEPLLSMPVDDQEEIVYQHSVLCQTTMPYRDPGPIVRQWDRRNGRVSMRIQAGAAYDATQDAWVDVGLPHGPKPRLVLFHLNTEAMRTKSPLLELEDSLTAFVRRTVDLDPKGRNIRTVKEQLTRLASADFRFGMGQDGHSIPIKTNVIEGFDLWTPKTRKAARPLAHHRSIFRDVFPKPRAACRAAQRARAARNGWRLFVTMNTVDWRRLDAT